ncbi:hypothetical protein RRG08_017464 [Elysia crispata]|uniref:Uncharacterized protein n=1 Tax=Elysia crispata TaxID=231223 RepID=A0AAE1CZS0_9GAST|nr:hypothetical protein RRG08_017464 [Elysia crispata]
MRTNLVIYCKLTRHDANSTGHGIYHVASLTICSIPLPDGLSVCLARMPDRCTHEMVSLVCPAVHLYTLGTFFKGPNVTFGDPKQVGVHGGQGPFSKTSFSRCPGHSKVRGQRFSPHSSGEMAQTGLGFM